VAFLAVVAFAVVPAAAGQRSAGIPEHGIFIVGKSIAGVGLGMTQKQVKAHWGSGYTVCTGSSLCTKKQPVWLFEYSQGEPLGVAVRFSNGKTVAVFTLGAVGVGSLSSGGGGGWETSLGLHMTDPISSIYTTYPAMTIDTQCEMYDALSEKHGGVTSSIYTSSGTVYGFALTAPGQAICQ
jgi:hypothetical protein